MNVDHGSGIIEIDLGSLMSEDLEYTVDHVVTTLEETTTMTRLSVVNYSEYDPTPENIRLFIDPLCRCIANLRSRNNDHLLREMFLSEDLDVGTTKKLLIAAKQFGIRQLVISGMTCPPVHVLGDFCRNNNNLKVLELHWVHFKDVVVGAGIFVPSTKDGMLDSEVIVALDKLVLREITFQNSTAATNFATLVARMSVSELEFGELRCGNDDDDNAERTKGIVSRMLLPRAEQLTLTHECPLEQFQGLLETGISSMSQLDVAINFDNGEATEKKNTLASFIRGAVKLNHLTIRFYSDTRNWQPPISFFAEALERCATVTTIRIRGTTVTRIQMCATTLHYDAPYRIPITQHEQRKLLRITSRNEELGRFVANPGTYPTQQLLMLMGQFNNCPSGLYTLSCHLPVVFSFDKHRAPLLKKKKRKQDDMEETNRKIMLENAQLRKQIELLHALIQQQQEERAALFPNDNKARIGVGNLLHDASSNGAVPESALLPQAQVTGNATADETPPDQQEQGTVEK